MHHLDSNFPEAAPWGKGLVATGFTSISIIESSTNSSPRP
jgi:hypothetical protein